ncbi:unnamed protein product [Closterium sp. NIES-53]
MQFPDYFWQSAITFGSDLCQDGTGTSPSSQTLVNQEVRQEADSGSGNLSVWVWDWQDGPRLGCQFASQLCASSWVAGGHVAAAQQQRDHHQLSRENQWCFITAHVITGCPLLPANKTNNPTTISPESLDLWTGIEGPDFLLGSHKSPKNIFKSIPLPLTLPPPSPHLPPPPQPPPPPPSLPLFPFPFTSFSLLNPLPSCLGNYLRGNID